VLGRAPGREALPLARVGGARRRGRRGVRDAARVLEFGEEIGERRGGGGGVHGARVPGRRGRGSGFRQWGLTGTQRRTWIALARCLPRRHIRP
jgi:hypothetical protein